MAFESFDAQEDRKKVNIEYRYKRYTARLETRILPASNEQMDAVLQLLDAVVKDDSTAIEIVLADEKQRENVPQEILYAFSPKGIYMELMYEMDDFNWNHPLLLANDHLSEAEATSVLYSILIDCTDFNPIIMNEFRNVSSDVYGEE